ncbi:hypothetical protein JYK21_16800 [Ralstonia pickettii]|nr:hypothetical protein [Ralstonia pickettii]
MAACRAVTTVSTAAWRSLWRQGMKAQAQRELIDAYRAAAAIPSNQQIVKARVLTGVGIALSTFAADAASTSTSRKRAS